jgi:hypothetical protein
MPMSLAYAMTTYQTALSLGIMMLMLAAGFGYLWMGAELGFFLALHASIRRAVRANTTLDAGGFAARSLHRARRPHRWLARVTGWRDAIPFDQAAMGVATPLENDTEP